MILVPLPGMTSLANGIARHLDAQVLPLDLHRFPDGESLVTLPDGLSGAEIALVASLRDPDRLALPLRFAAATARELGAVRVGLVAPYLGYMRQDRRFEAGQAISALLFAQFLGESFEWLVTVDPHLHRIAQLDDVFPMPTVRVPSASLIAAWVASEVPDAILLGPDSESQQWVADVAQMAGLAYEVLRKRRIGDRQVEVSAPEGADLSRGTPVILDDIASSGRTMVRAVERVLAAGAKPPVCVLIHAVFSDRAFDDILTAGAARVVTTDTIPHPSNAISVAECLAAAIQAAAFEGLAKEIRS
ncbi:ribose-phosphate diphosphokinase [Stappia sp. F7233]|uniref:Ribose-phosphate diphosphokinase n=1 Tax=Stappia albiluteola TaxID=2758565 RepID=A0A839A989_9HYPH|nr:ribose-phosphate diphosphokinase [Stappia albiluteola]MBA5775522.1 ribose-phosphate diphosphokinase [Stappia albiluteola]